MNITKKGAVLLCSLGLIAGIVGTVAMQTHAASTADTATNTTVSDTPVVDNATTATTDTTATNTTDKPDVTVPAKTDSGKKGHAPLGGDGNITAINGTTITMQEEADEGGASYSVDASKATVTKNGAAAKISDLKVGDKIFVQGTTSGTNVAAISVSVGKFGKCGNRTKTSQPATN